MTDLHLKNLITAGFASFFLLLAVQASMLLGSELHQTNRLLLATTFVILLIGGFIAFYVTRQIRQKETTCHVESAKARNAVEKLRWQATHDSLTRLVNRREFRRRVIAACRQAEKTGAHHVIAQINLDRFKTVNDHCGHRAGDTLLSQLPSLLKEALTDKDTLARISGDEFALLLLDTDMMRGKEVAEQLRKIVSDFRFSWDNRDFEVGASIGVVPINQKYCHLQEVLTAADTACHQAKTAGRNRVCVLESCDQLLVERQGNVRCAQELPRAIRSNRMELYAQEICPLWANEPGHYYELLVRLNLENGKQMSPKQFIPVAEQYGLAVDLDRWVIYQALAWLGEQNQAAALCSLGDESDCYCKLSINLSGQSISDTGFLNEVLSILNEANVSPGQLVFEITETAAVTNLSAAQHFIDALHQQGCKFALDDFGSGMSSFGYLQKLDVDYVKIDGSLVSKVAKGGSENAMINAIVHVAQSMGAKTIAEYVEDKLTQSLLESAGVDYVQGYLVHKPVPLRGIGSAIRADTRQMTLAV
jgi:Amt family ammonium transporter